MRSHLNSDTSFSDEDPFLGDEIAEDDWSNKCQLYSTGEPEEKVNLPENLRCKTHNFGYGLSRESILTGDIDPIQIESNSISELGQEMERPIQGGLSFFEDELNHLADDDFGLSLPILNNRIINIDNSQQEQNIQQVSGNTMHFLFAEQYFQSLENPLFQRPSIESALKQEHMGQLIKEEYIESMPSSGINLPLKTLEEETSAVSRGRDSHKRKKVNRLKENKKAEEFDQQKPKTYRDMFKQIKNTNMPKKLLRILRASLRDRLHALRQSLSTSSLIDETEQNILRQQLRLLMKSYAKLDRRSSSNVGTKDLTACFCGNQDDQIMNRRTMKAILGVCIFDEVFQNSSIPDQNKFSYAKCLKIIEWRVRVSDGTLADRVGAVPLLI